MVLGSAAWIKAFHMIDANLLTMVDNLSLLPPDSHYCSNEQQW